MNVEELPIQISVQSVNELLEGGADFVLLDCREESEYKVAKIAGSVLEPMSHMQARQQQLLELKDRHVVVHCHLGGRSMQVVQWLRQMGFERCQNMDGGIEAWSVEIDSSVPRY
ncbi:MAG: rhodanese-like domain-containing protein [Pirellulaceae bacterium]|jgi:rhodanese-related sulfurtransferase|nr:rhodanese-like domain-containing protein [Pirellulaceae bacterium]MDP7017153.1 rhodanese-like domain-containing protein [Pirellulaceae bacterium]